MRAPSWWFRVDEKLPDDTRVKRLAHRLKISHGDAFLAFCRVLRLLHDYDAPGFDPELVHDELIDAEAGIIGFAGELLQVGLAEARVGGLCVDGAEGAKAFRRSSELQANRARGGKGGRAAAEPRHDRGGAAAEPRPSRGSDDVGELTEAPTWADDEAESRGSATAEPRSSRGSESVCATTKSEPRLDRGKADLEIPEKTLSDADTCSGSGSGSVSSQPYSETAEGSSTRVQVGLPGVESGAAPARVRRGRGGGGEASVVEKWRPVAERLWELQEALRREALPGSRTLRANDERLKRVADRLEAGASEADCEHVLRVYAAEANPRWFNGETNWRPGPFGQALGMVIAPRASPSRDVRVGHVQITGDEQYRNGIVEDF